jgi:hypothetical protein
MELFPQISINISVHTFIEQEGLYLNFIMPRTPLGEIIKLKFCPGIELMTYFLRSSAFAH